MKKLLLALLICANLLVGAQMEVDNSLTPEDLVEILVGEGIEFSNVTFEGDLNQFGSFINANDIGIGSGIILATGDCEFAENPNNQGGGSLGGGNSGASDDDLDAISNVNTNDKAVLEFDFVPTGSLLNFNYVFGSEEYDDYECCTVNDAFGFFISGPDITGPFSSPAEFPGGSINIALIPDTDIGVSINTVNSGNANCGEENCSNLDPNWQDNTIFFTSNAGGQEIQYDGFTVPLEATVEVTCSETYHIKLAIADGGDTAWDSGVMLQEGSFAAADPVVDAVPDVDDVIEIPESTLIEGCVDGILTITRGSCLGDETLEITLGGTAEMLSDYLPIETTYYFSDGVAEVEIPIITVADVFDEPTEQIVFQLEFTNSQGEVDVSEAVIDIIDYTPMQTSIGNLVACADGSEIASINIASGIGPYDIEWSNGDTTLTSEYFGNVAGTHSATVMDACGESSTAFFELTNPEILIATVEDIFICPESSTTASTNISGGFTPYSVVWSNGGTGTSNSYDAGTPGEQWAIITDDCGVQDSAFFEISEPQPIAIGNIESFYCLGLDTDAFISGGTFPYQFVYDNPDLDTLGNGGFTSYTPGIYDVTVVDACNQSADFTIEFASCETKIPNVFTPTGSINDVYNNVFWIEGVRGFRGSSLRVFNRWGTLVYEDADYRNTWDGEENPDGTYYYVFERSDGEIFTGYVQILRKQLD